MTVSIADPHPDDSGGRGICVIIPVLGEQHLTDAVIKDLRDDGYRCTIYVVDNGGDYRPRGVEHVLRPRRNLHWAGGCNFGLSTVKDRSYAAYVLLNNDVRLSRGFLRVYASPGRAPEPACSLLLMIVIGRNNGQPIPGLLDNTGPEAWIVWSHSLTVHVYSSLTAYWKTLACWTSEPGHGMAGDATRTTL